MKLGELLKEKGLIKQEQLNHALHKQNESVFVYRTSVRLGDVLVKLGYIDSKVLEEVINKNGHN